MIKPPKTTSGNRSSDSSSITRSSQDPTSSNRVNTGLTDAPLTGSDQAAERSSLTLSASDDIASRVVVTHITDPVLLNLNTNLREISWPALQNHLLQPHESIDGLYVNPKGELYAHLEEGGYYRAELNSNGDYQIPWPAAPGVTPPLLKKIDGQPRWRVEAHWYSRTSEPQHLGPPVVTAEPASISFIIEPTLASLLPPAQNTADGMRYDKYNNSYVDLAEGTVMIRRNAQGEYQETLAKERVPTGPVVEQIPGTQLWRRKTANTAQPDNRRPAPETDEPTAGPSKRPRMEGETGAGETHIPIQLNGDWQAWGNATKPQTGDSIEIDGNHYPIVAQAGHANDARVFIKSPQFSAVRFDDFEQMLRVNPQLQPLGAVKIKDKWPFEAVEVNWKVVDGRPFQKTLTQYVADSFPCMADHSASKVARTLFNRANHSDEMNGYGLNGLFETFQHWASRHKFPSAKHVTRPDLLDPLLLLPPLPKDTNNDISMPLPTAEGLQRIDFDLQRFPKDWFSILYGQGQARGLFWEVLTQQGYDVSFSFRSKQKDALLIRRRDVDLVYLLFFPDRTGDKITRPDWNSWIKKQVLIDKREPEINLLNKSLAENNVVYLLGQTEIQNRTTGNLVIIRDA